MTPRKKYVWLIDTIQRAGRISFCDLSRLWEADKAISDYKPLHRATFNRWREAIEDLYGIRIECQRKGGNYYFIENVESVDENKLKQWRLDTFSIRSVIKEDVSLKNRILVNEVPSGHDHLEAILNAMKENRKVNIVYKPFGQNSDIQYNLEPYCVKLFDNRWYVLGKTSGETKILCLDRIESLDILEETFSLPKNFNASHYFSNYYGVVLDENVNHQRIVIQANKQSKEYIKSLPLHPSQRLLEDSENFADFELYLAPTYDFIMKLLQHGAMVEVLKPESLRQVINGWIRDLNEMYDI
ncbi:MAG: WYL domain-containing protein [Muribaculaceae bacterium]|nr:WYL domain-containing protein [Muribaculaceae bacterium]